MATSRRCGGVLNACVAFRDVLNVEWSVCVMHSGVCSAQREHRATFDLSNTDLPGNLLYPTLVYPKTSFIQHSVVNPHH